MTRQRHGKINRNTSQCLPRGGAGGAGGGDEPQRAALMNAGMKP